MILPRFNMLLAQADAPAQAGEAAPQVTPGDPGILAAINPYLPVFFVAFFVAIIATPIMRTLAIRNGIIDWPDLQRKAHLTPVAYLGGLAICLGWLAGVLSCYFLAEGRPFPIEIILGAAAITITGILDDVYGIRARVKVGGQLFAAAALASVVLTPGGEAIGVELMGSVFSIVGLGGAPHWLIYTCGTLLIAFFVLGGCNAVNLIDGLDGLASGVVAIAVGGFLCIAGLVALEHIAADGGDGFLKLSDTARIVMCLAVLGAIVGFLPYNFNPATIFMGDAGSLLLGYLSMTTILLFADTQVAALNIVTACLIVFALPITDTSLAIVRRRIRGQSMFAPDAQHMHHLLRKRGLSVKKAVAVMYGLALMFAVLGVSMIALDLRWRNVLLVFVVLYGFIMVTAFKVGQQQLIREQLAEAEALQQARLSNGGAHGEPGPGVIDQPPAEAPASGEDHGRSRAASAPPANDDQGSMPEPPRRD